MWTYQDIFYLFGIILLVNNFNDLYYFIFKKRKKGVKLPDDLGEAFDKGLSYAKDFIKITPKKVLFLVCFLWMVAGIIISEESKLFIILITVDIGFDIILYIKSCYDGYIKYYKRELLPESKLIDETIWHHTIKHSLSIFIILSIFYSHYF